MNTGAHPMTDITFEQIRDKKVGFGKYKNKTFEELLNPEYDKYINWIIKQRQNSEKNNFFITSKNIALLLDEYEKRIEKQSTGSTGSIPAFNLLIQTFEKVVIDSLNKGYNKPEEFMDELKKALDD